MNRGRRDRELHNADRQLSPDSPRPARPWAVVEAAAFRDVGHLRLVMGVAATLYSPARDGAGAARARPGSHAGNGAPAGTAVIRSSMA